VVDQVDCLALDTLCKQADASSGSPSVHFYRDGRYVSKVFWENPDLVRAQLEVVSKKLVVK
jgi:hypothetical protein